jgi:hypothetical protein
VSYGKTNGNYELRIDWTKFICKHSSDMSVQKVTYKIRLDEWLTVHRSITMVDLQLDAQNSNLFTYNTFIKILYMFRALPCSSSGGLRRYCIYAASGIVTLCRLLFCAPVKKKLLTGAKDSHLQRVTMPEAAYIQLRLRSSRRWGGQCSKHVEDFNKRVICKQIRILCIKLEINQGDTNADLQGHETKLALTEL